MLRASVTASRSGTVHIRSLETAPEALLLGRHDKGEFARKLGITKSTLHRIEMNEQNVGLDTLELICKRLKCGIPDLFFPEKD